MPGICLTLAGGLCYICLVFVRMKLNKKEGTKGMSVLSVVLPAYNEELMIAKTCSVLGEVLTDAGISYGGTGQ